MASVINRPGGHKWVQFKWSDLRRTLRLGKASPQQARDVARYVESILASRKLGLSMEPAAAHWVASLPPKLRGSLAKMDLIDAAQVATVGQLCAVYEASLAGAADSTLVNVRVGLLNAQKFFGQHRALVDVTPADAKDFKTWLREQGGKDGGKLSIATASRRAGRLREMFALAVAKRWIASNPFADVRRDDESNRERDHFVDAATFDKILASCTDQGFRTILVLARYGGLRCPSEVLPLTWEQIDWDEQLIHVQDRKRKKIRSVPLFPEVHRELDALWALAAEKETLVFPNHQISQSSLRDRLERLCTRNKIWLWPKAFQNMRATRETELLDEFAAHVVYAWIGHCKKVSDRFYAQISKEHHARAVAERLPRASLLPQPKKRSTKSEALNRPEA